MSAPRRTAVVIPDLHGRADLLEAAVTYAENTWENPFFVGLGDAIDRGPRSLRCVEQLLALRQEGRALLLIGNHERMALEGLKHLERFEASGDPEDYRRALQGWRWWMDAGGRALRDEVPNLTLETFPPVLREYLHGLPRIIFVDAAGKTHPGPPAHTPSVMVAHASPPKPHPDYGDPMSALLWLRPEDGPYHLPPGVTYSVHGHTPVRVAVQYGEQVYLDLGAYKTGRLALLPLNLSGDITRPQGLTVLEGRGNPAAADSLRAFGHMLPAELVRV